MSDIFRIDPIAEGIQSAEAAARLDQRRQRVTEREGGGGQQHAHQRQQRDEATLHLSEEELDVGTYDEHGRPDHHDHDIPHDVAKPVTEAEGRGHVDRLV